MHQTTPAQSLGAAQPRLLISDADDHRIDRARLALNAMCAMTLSAADMAVKLKQTTGSVATLDIPPEALHALLELVAGELTLNPAMSIL